MEKKIVYQSLSSVAPGAGWFRSIDDGGVILGLVSLLGVRYDVLV